MLGDEAVYRLTGDLGLRSALLSRGSFESQFHFIRDLGCLFPHATKCATSTGAYGLYQAGRRATSSAASAWGRILQSNTASLPARHAAIADRRAEWANVAMQDATSSRRLASRSVLGCATSVQIRDPAPAPNRDRFRWGVTKLGDVLAAPRRAGCSISTVTSLAWASVQECRLSG